MKITSCGIKIRSNYAMNSSSTYVCPMHAEVRQEGPGRCPKCGMALVQADAPKAHGHIADKGLGVFTWRSYMPLIVIISLIFASAVAGAYPSYLNGSASLSDFILHFMTGFFLVFAGFKLLDLK